MSTKIPVAPLGADAATADEFQVYSAPSLVRFLSRGVQPPSQIYLKHTDTLQVQCASSQTGESVTFNYRLLRADGSLIKGQFTIQVPATRAVVTQKEPMAEGFLLSLSCKAAVGSTRGMTFARAYLTSGALGANQPSYTLMADYVTTQFAAAYPNGRILAPTEGPGVHYVITPATPAAGAEWTQTVPTNARWRYNSAKAFLGTSAAVANRQPGLLINIGSNLVFIGSAESNVVAGASTFISYSSIRNQPIDPTRIVWTPMPDGYVAQGGDTIGSTTPNLQAADQYSGIFLAVEEWLDNV